MSKVRIRKRGKTFSYAFEAGKVDGRRRVIEHGGYATKEEAYQAGTEEYINFKHGDIGITSERITVNDFLDLWLKYIKDNVRIQTYTTYRSQIEHSIKPYIGDTILQDLTPAKLDSWMYRLYNTDKSKGTLTNIRMILREALTYAVYPCQLIASNPANYIKVPKNAPEHIVQRVVISREQYNDLLEACKSKHALSLAIKILYNTGLRIGEVIGLCWDDIDFEIGTLTVSHQVTHYEKHDHIAEPKTKSSYRSIFLTPDFLSMLKHEKAMQEMNEDLLAEEYIVYTKEQSGLVVSHSAAVKTDRPRVRFICINAIGKHILESYVQKKLRKLGINSHSFRHTQATRLAELGVPPVAVAARLGHANTDTTLNLYTHNTEEQQKRIAEGLEKEDMLNFFDS